MARGISLLVDSPWRELMLAMRAVPTETKRQITAAARREAKPMWLDETRSRATTRIQQQVLVRGVTVSVTARNVIFKSGGKGTLSSGTPAAVLIDAAEFGMSPDALISTRSRKGTSYKRRAGDTFVRNGHGSNVIYPAARAVVPRMVSLYVQTAHRTVHEAIEKG